ncbi:2,3,4,5-tetrahydropyridine-2,6-dicarboxylate N-succinyltransferase [Fluviispira multicolorata]|uniref:2,3,4,5-tetrahydropyridine-2,6-dicarboxylate N-succinyltransferase n=1 Tax=Fluviispira multicolorata TaxID=2654512 RepID=A0A833JF16_9BACT|nr:2,3,4,5-tetrahydropyridine-2,6-dicarboxylate N-succinyltransferase [Fluviispira multicolorata]KAB8033496.1 2,3,4,5-tetrahydropyridine-2,6-dicarboxylate N-succinyltransferase [Fluviispira multicolorata]
MNQLNDLELKQLKSLISKSYGNWESLKNKELQEAVTICLRHIEKGFLRVVSPKGMQANCFEQEMIHLQEWEVHSWVKQSILMAMRLRTAETFHFKFDTPLNLDTYSRVHAGLISYHDKFDVRNDLATYGVRSAHGSIVREGAYVSQGVILMPSFVNIGAWIGSGTMIDTWATAGSCTQIGKNVHIAGGVGIGGVLEPENARPVLIGDNAFLGSRVVVVEGSVVSEGAVLGANVCLTSSTPIYDMTTPDKKEYRGYVPPNAVVAAGTRIKSFPGGDIPLQCAYIIAYRNQKTDVKVSLNDILRETGIPI